jgi:DNA invertase Pin-like site-specific DNA recombinase
MDYMRAVLYGRFSSHNQKDASIEQQFRDCREYCEKNDIKIIGEYADRALSGKTDKRPEFQRMIKDAAKGRFQIIVCWKVDRFARNREDAAVYKGRLRRHGVRILYAKESIPEGPEGILLESMLEGTAEYYSANLSQNIKRGMRDNALNCKVNNGNLPLGYQKGPDGRFAIEPAGAVIVREVFELYASGMNVTQITNALNSRGLKTSRGVPFNKNSLRVMLKNERYTGMYIYSDVRVDGGMPQIIGKELFDKVQNQIDKTKRAPAAARSEIDYLLTGKLFCGHCGSSMVGESGTGKSGAKFHYYICVKKKREKACSKRTVTKEWIEDAVVRMTVDEVLVDEVIQRIADAAVALQERERDTSVLDSLESQYKETDKSLKNLLTAIEQGIITPTTRDRMIELEHQRDELGLAIEEEKVVKPFFTREQLIYWMERFRNADLTDERVRISIIESFVSAIYLYDDELRIVYNYCGEKKTVTLAVVDGCDKEGAPECSALAFQSPPPEIPIGKPVPMGISPVAS